MVSRRIFAKTRATFCDFLFPNWKQKVAQIGPRGCRVGAFPPFSHSVSRRFFRNVTRDGARGGMGGKGGDLRDSEK